MNAFMNRRRVVQLPTDLTEVRVISKSSNSCGNCCADSSSSEYDYCNFCGTTWKFISSDYYYGNTPKQLWKIAIEVMSSFRGLPYIGVVGGSVYSEQGITLRTQFFVEPDSFAYKWRRALSTATINCRQARRALRYYAGKIFGRGRS